MADTHLDPQVMPYLYYEDAAEALDFLVDAFGFEVQSEVRDAEGMLWAAQLRIGEGVVLIGPGLEAFGSAPVPDPEISTSRTHVYVSDLDAHYQQACAAGAVIRAEPADHFNGSRLYVAADCGDQQWIFAEAGAAERTPFDHDE